MTTELCEWQEIDEGTGICFPWFTHPCLEVIKKWDLSDKVIMEWGMGLSTVWWAIKSKLVLSVDHDLNWFYRVSDELKAFGLDEKVNSGCVQTHEGDVSEGRDTYVKHFEINNQIIKNQFPDFSPVSKINIAVVDGIHRYECAEYAVKVLKPEILIIDNHQQDYVFICPKLDELLEGVRMERYVQPDHTNHEGRPWATAIFYLNEKS